MQRRKNIWLIIAAIAAITSASVLFVLDQKATAPKPDQNQVLHDPASSKEVDKTPDTVAKPQPKPFDKTAYSINDPNSIWIIANKSRPLNPLTYSPDDLTNTGNGQMMRKEAAAALQTMIQSAAAAKLQLQPLSGYRSYQTQKTVYANEVATYGQAVADRESAKPGYSEHQTGLSMDVGGGGCGIEDCFGRTDVGKWVAANAYKFGFIIRYPEGKESVTGYRYEPWHVRYVGNDLATEMHRTNVQTLEEFFKL